MGATGRNSEGMRTGVFARLGFLRTKQLSRARELGGYYFYLFLFLLQMLLCCGLAPDSETKFYSPRWVREESLTPNGRINAPGAWEAFLSWYNHRWVKKGSYFRFPQVQNPAVELSKSCSSICQLFSNFAQLI